MKVNKDLTDAVMMVSFIILVLVGTTTFDNETNKYIIMAILGGITAIMAGFRIYGLRHEDKQEEKEIY